MYLPNARPLLCWWLLWCSLASGLTTCDSLCEILFVVSGVICTRYCQLQILWDFFLWHRTSFPWEKTCVFSRVDCVFNVLENSSFFIRILVPPDFLSLSVLPVLCFVMLKKNLHFSQNSFDSCTTASHWRAFLFWLAHSRLLQVGGWQVTVLTSRSSLLCLSFFRVRMSHALRFLPGLRSVKALEMHVYLWLLLDWVWRSFHVTLWPGVSLTESFFFLLEP